MTSHAPSDDVILDGNIITDDLILNKDSHSVKFAYLFIPSSFYCIPFICMPHCRRRNCACDKIAPIYEYNISQVVFQADQTLNSALLFLSLIFPFC